MKLLSMTATFGKLHKATLTFADGLNIIHAPNEGGKSTWAAFWKAMLFGLDTRDRDKKGHLADKNRYQPWSGAPMEGELVLEWQGRTIVIRRGQRGATPFGRFSATYADSGQPVPGLTGANCGQTLTGVSREVFERSAFIGSDALPVTPTPDLERRIAALLSSGQEDVSFSQTQARLKEWLNRRKVNRTVGLIPKLEQELEQLEDKLGQLRTTSARLAALEGEHAALRQEKQALEGELDLHARLAQKQLNTRFAQAQEELAAAQTQLERLEGEMAKFGQLPPKEELKRVQFDLQYLKVLDEQIKAAAADLEQADEAYIQAQIAIQDPHFTGMTGEEAQERARNDRHSYEQWTKKGDNFRVMTGALFLLLLVAAFITMHAVKNHVLANDLPWSWVYPGVGLYAAVAIGLPAFACFKRKQIKKRCAAILERYRVDAPEGITALAAAYAEKYQTAQNCADRAKTIRGALNDLMARKENSRTDIFAFVHTFAPEVKELFGCSAALSRALSFDHEHAAARERVRERSLRLEDLAAQGGQPFQTLELLHSPQRTPEQTRTALAQVSAQLEQTARQLHHARGAQQTLGDSAALYARMEQVRQQLERRTREHQALTLALETLDRANEALQQRFSPQLNAKTGEYLAALTGNRYTAVSLNRELEGQTAPAGELLPRSALYLSRGTADQLYLALRLAVCDLCLEQRPPLVLDDALLTFDDARLDNALNLLRARAQSQQILLFTCQRREEQRLEAMP